MPLFHTMGSDGKTHFCPVITSIIFGLGLIALALIIIHGFMERM